MKTYYVQRNVGRVRYLINHHDGLKAHADGSPFFDVTICRNRQQFKAALAGLKGKGYVESR